MGDIFPAAWARPERHLVLLLHRWPDIMQVSSPLLLDGCFCGKKTPEVLAEKQRHVQGGTNYAAPL